MDKALDFFIAVSKLKKVERTGWVWRGVKNPETIAQHSFRVALMNWFLGEKTTPRFNIEKVIKISLAHDLCEVYAGDTTPYWGLLPEDPEKRQEALKRWVRLTRKKKEERAKIKFEKEDKALKKLVEFLPDTLQREIKGLWTEYEEYTSPEGRFVKQGDKVETLLQALEYFEAKDDSPVFAWWEEIEDLVDHPVLLGFLVDIEKKFYGKEKKTDPLLDFLLEVGKLKALPRRGWVVRGIKKPETIADHSFLVALMVWVLGEGRKIDMGKALKMTLIHEICAVSNGDCTPHDTFSRRINSLPRCYNFFGARWAWQKFFWHQRSKLTQKKKSERFFKDYERETRTLRTLIGSLSPNLKQDILRLWTDFNEKKSWADDFVDQVNCLATFLQACQYWQEDNSFPIKVFGEQVAGFISDPKLVEFLGAMKKKFNLTK